jgi:signal transduction histidine kinase
MRATIASILGGRKDRRVEVGAAGDEFDELASQFNRLLDENDRLVTQVRDVTNDIAHDLRTPLQRMQGRLESALAAPSTPPEARRVLESFASDSERLLEVFNGLLQLARLESDELRRSMQPVSVETVVREIADLYAPLAEEAGLALRVDVEPRLTITADRQLLAQAISNLIDNALKYGAGGDAIQLDARRAADGVEIAVADHGAGIPEADRERVLGRLVRLDASRGIPGTGLGLSLVAAVARLHGGMLRLEDNQPGVRALLRVRTSPGEAEAASLDSCEAPAPGRIATSARRCISAGCVALPAP